MQFREDINMLRAIAVIAVVLFHFYPELLPGGFIGVDIFFVISGFLMTSIIMEAIKQQKFSIIDFYLNRAYRIIPALAVLCLVLLALGWFWLTTVDYMLLGKHVASSISFISNFIYRLEAGYFDTTSKEKWLLHTWSLSIEWQFYIIYPIVLSFLAKRYSLKTIKNIVLLGGGISFLLCLIASKLFPRVAYYFLPCRAWELLIGAIAYFYPCSLIINKYLINKIIFFFGLLLILVSCFCISSNNLWPGYMALLPTLGAVFIIQARYNQGLIAKNIAFQKLGKWSYSIYLWHWPLAVATFVFEVNNFYRLIAIMFTVTFGYISYNYIEAIKFKSLITTYKNWLKYIPVYCVVIICCLSSYIYSTNGSNANAFLLHQTHLLHYPDYCHNSKNIDCYFPEKPNKKPAVLLWGDSFAGRLHPFISELLGKEHSFILRSSPSCFPCLISDMLSFKSDVCSKQRLACISDINNKLYHIIFLAGNWEYMYEHHNQQGFDAVMETVDFCIKNAKLVYFIAGPVHYKHHVSNSIMRQQVSSLYPYKIKRNDKQAQEINNKFKQALIAKNYSNLYFIDRESLYGLENYSDFTPGGLPYTFDTGHLSIAGSIEFAKIFMQTALFLPLKKLLDNKQMR
jgi:peptidoglycan/LPS O-acetylase OafA/YrhL